MGLFEYRAGTAPEGGFRLKPSSISKLIDNPHAWYESNIQGKNDFHGNTNTRLGSIIHALVENYYTKEYTYYEIVERAKVWLEEKEEPDQWKIIDSIEPMYNAWVKEYAEKYQKLQTIEGWVEYQPHDKIIVSGSYDALDGDTVVDYKTTGRKKSDLGDYWVQLYTYAWLLRKNGVTVNNVRIVYIQTPLKSGAVNIVTVEEPIDESAMSELVERIKDESMQVLETLDDPSLISRYFKKNWFSHRK